MGLSAGAIAAGAAAALLIPVEKAVAPIILALGSASLEAVFWIFLHGGLNTVDWLVKMGRELKIIEELEQDTTLSGSQKLAKATRVLLEAAVAHGKEAAKDEVHFAVELLVAEYRRVSRVAQQSIHDNLGGPAPAPEA